MNNDSLGDRMKQYESVPDHYLVRKVPVIGRVDGRAFHTLTKNLHKPWDLSFVEAMIAVASFLVNEIQGAKIAHVASDEVSILLTDYEQVLTEGWFGYRLNKMTAIAAAMATMAFNKVWPYDGGAFDARFFNLPKEEVCNYFIWRQQDATRNSVSALARAFYSHNELFGKTSSEMQNMLMQKGVNWNDTPVYLKRGTCVIKNGYENCIDKDTPLFTQSRDYIERYVFPENNAKTCLAEKYLIRREQ